MGLICKGHVRLADPELIATACEKTGVAIRKARLRFLKRADVAQRSRELCVDAGEKPLRSLCAGLFPGTECEAELLAKTQREPCGC